MNLFDKDSLSPVLIDDINRKINALGHEPRVIVEFDKMSYVPGMKSKFQVWDRIRSASIDYFDANEDLSSPVLDEPDSIVGGGESGDRFMYIKCAFNREVKSWKLPDQAYYFLLAVAKHETAFGTLGQGKPAKGSFIVGYGCPGSCDFTYSGVDTQAYYACKRYNDAMKSRYGAINSRGYMTADDIDYFHEGGDKGYGNWKWSADGVNWKNRVKTYYDNIRNAVVTAAYPSKWHCKEANSIGHIEDGKARTMSATPMAMARAAVSDGGTTGGGGLTAAVFPIEGISFGTDAKVSSHHQKHSGGRSGHKGIDLVHKTSGKVNGMYVLAAWSGVVEKAYKSTSYGNCVMITHSNGYSTVYAHMQDNSLLVRPGQSVGAGARLGKVGNTGQSSGPHLHFEVWKGKWVYGGSSHLDPYWVLLGSQLIGAEPVTDNGSGGGGGGSTNPGTGGSGEAPPKPREITTSYKFNKCFDKNGTLDKNWIDKSNVKHFTSTKTGEKYIGFNGNMAPGTIISFGYKHNFSSDGFYEYSFFLDLGAADSLTVAYDGIQVKRYTSGNNTKQPTYESPIHAKYSGVEVEGANSHILSFTLDNVSGKAVFGIKCFKVAEVNATYGTWVSESLLIKKRDVLVETGAFVYDTTYTLENDIMEWSVNSHFDSRVGTATITLDNKHGTYSPSYERTTNFPENRREAEMSYYEEGAIRHVLSEATPVRIYAGYGENMVRVFTGKIKGEIQEDSENRTVTISCVDMYDVLEEHVFDRMLTFPRRDEIHEDEKQLTMWVKSAIVHNIINEVGLINWRYFHDDLEYADAIIDETYYIDIDRGGTTAVVWDSKKQEYVDKKIATVKDAYGYKNPYVQAVDFEEGTRASDAIEGLIGELMYRAYCDRYGTFRLQNIRDMGISNDKWEFIDGENLQSLTTSVDHSRVRNHLIITGSAGNFVHFVDKELYIATKGNMRTAKIVLDWVDESYGATARGIKEEVADRLFFDMKRQARTFNVVVKGNPMIEVLDGAYIYDRNTSTVGYYIIKGNKLSGTKDNGMTNTLELMWQDVDSHKVEETAYWIPPETSPENVEGDNLVACGKEVKSGNQAATFTHKVTDKGYVYVDYWMYVAKDKISVFVNGKLKWSTGKAVSEDEGGPIAFYYKPSDGDITIKINDGGVDYSTGWKYTLYCPGTAPASVMNKAHIV